MSNATVRANTFDDGQVVWVDGNLGMVMECFRRMVRRITDADLETAATRRVRELRH